MVALSSQEQTSLHPVNYMRRFRFHFFKSCSRKEALRLKMWFPLDVLRERMEVNRKRKYPPQQSWWRHVLISIIFVGGRREGNGGGRRKSCLPWVLPDDWIAGKPLISSKVIPPSPCSSSPLTPLLKPHSILIQWDHTVTQFRESHRNESKGETEEGGQRWRAIKSNRKERGKKKERKKEKDALLLPTALSESQCTPAT